MSQQANLRISQHRSETRKRMATSSTNNVFAGLSGRLRLPAGEPLMDLPLVVALHGGTYTSAYFDVPGYSLLDRAGALGIPILAVDRPGYEDSPSLEGEDASIQGHARFLTKALQEAWERYGAATRGIVLIGHSIGDAIAISMAANPDELPLLGLAVSGVRLNTPEAFRDQFAATPDALTIDFPTPLKDHVMFGPEGSFHPAMPKGSHPANGPALRREIIDINTVWTKEVRTIAQQVRVPVHYRQAQVDRLWIVDEREIRQFAEAFTQSPRVDAAMVRDTGHCMDFHRISAALQVQQLGFALQCAVER